MGFGRLDDVFLFDYQYGKHSNFASKEIIRLHRLRIMEGYGAWQSYLFCLIFITNSKNLEV